MFTQHLMQSRVEQMRRSVIAHDVVTASHIHFSESEVADLRLP
jgi:hypothetical protein